MKPNQPKFVVGDTVVYKSGKRGYHWGWDNGATAIVKKIFAPLPKLPNDSRPRRTEWGGFTILTDKTSMKLPAAWFRKLALGLTLSLALAVASSARAGPPLVCDQVTARMVAGLAGAVAQARDADRSLDLLHGT